MLREDLVLGLDPGFPLGRVSDAAVDSRGRILVADSGFDVVLRLSPRGDSPEEIGRTGEGPGEFGKPLRVAVGPSDRIYVASGGNRVVVFESDGSPADFEIRRVNPGPVQGLEVGGDGEVYTVCFDPVAHTMIHRYRGGTGEHAASFCASYGAGKDIPLRIEQTYASGSLDRGPDGLLYYVQTAPQLVRVYDPSGELRATHPARHDDAPEPPEARVRGETVHFSLDAASNRVVALDGGRFLTGFGRREDGDWVSTLDLYGPGGERLAVLRPETGLTLLAADGEGRVLAAEVRDDLPVLVRYRIVAPE